MNERLNNDEFVKLMIFLGQPILTKTEKNILSYMLQCDNAFTFSNLCKWLDYPIDEIKDCFRKVYTAFKCYDSEDGDRRKRRYIFDETIVGRNTGVLDSADKKILEEDYLENIKHQVDEIDFTYDKKNGVLFLVKICPLLEHKKYLVFAIKKLKDHCYVWRGKEACTEKYNYSNLLKIANNTFNNYDYTDAQRETVNKCINFIKKNDYFFEMKKKIN